MGSERSNKPISITLTPETKMALEILKQEKQSENVSQIIDETIRSAVIKLGYQLKENKVYSYQKGQVEVNLIVDNKPAYKISHNNETFVQAPLSGQYTIQITNRSSARKLAVISVDGRNVMDGEKADYQGGGYVLSPWETLNVKGWRRTNEEVAAFEFVDIEQSYDKLVGGSGSNVGVIGVAVFDEKVVQRTWYKSTPIVTDLYRGGYETTDFDPTLYSTTLSRGITISATNGDSSSLLSASNTANSTAEMTNSVEPTSTVGTGYGAKTEMKVREVTFERATSNPCDVIVVRYATEPTLKKWGVIRDPVMPTVNPFPEEKVAVKAPPGWNG